MKPRVNKAAIYGSMWNKWLVIALRLMVGAVFAFSGFAKAIDPWGSYYKFYEYFMALGLSQWAGEAMFLAFAVGVVEFMLGVSVLVGAYRRVAPAMALASMAIMLPLTLWLAITNAIPDCGCFGDALILSNWATFWKNVAITVAAVWLLVYNRSVRPLYGASIQWMVALASFAFPMALAIVGYATQPLIDFRPFKVGTKLTYNDEASANGEDYIFIYEKNGKQQEFSIDSLPDDDDTTWHYVDRRLRHEQAQPLGRGSNSLAIFALDGGEVTSEVLDADSSELLLLFPDLENVNIAYTFALNELYDFATSRGVRAYGLTSTTSSRVIDDWNDISLASYPLYTVDDSSLKMLARGNPSVVYVEHGVIKWKRTLSSLDPSIVHDGTADLQDLGNDFQPQRVLRRLAMCYVGVMLLLLVAYRLPGLIKKCVKRLRRNKK